MIADAAGQTVWRWDNTEPFGDTVADENPSGLGAFPFPLRFPGTYDDPETNGLYNYFRDLDRALGRYRQSDLIGLRGGLNTYAYVENNPLARVDPKGLQSVMPYPGPFPGQPSPTTIVCAFHPEACLPPRPTEGQCFVTCSVVDLTIGYSAEAAAERIVERRVVDEVGKMTCKVLFKGFFYIETAVTLNKCYRICYECGGQSCPPTNFDPSDPNSPKLPPLVMDPQDPRRTQRRF